MHTDYKCTPLQIAPGSIILLGATEDILDMVAHHARSNRLCVVFDEFQDMLNVENAQAVLATMRSKIQFQPNTP